MVFSWVTWPSRQVREAGMKKVMVDPRLQPDVNPMPFDGKLPIYGRFAVLVDARREFAAAIGACPVRGPCCMSIIRCRRIQGRH